MDYTSKLSLTKPADDDSLNACRENWDRLDRSFTGAIWVLPDVIPEDELLFDGALVAEIGTGKVWRAQRNATTGLFDRKWVKYPWTITATFVIENWPNGVSDLPMSFTAVDQDQCVNSSINDIFQGRILLPIDAIYTGKMLARWEQWTGPRSMKLSLGHTIGVDTVNTEVIDESYASFPYPTLNYSFTRKFVAGSLPCGSFWQNSGQGTGVRNSFRMEMAVVTPL